MDTPMGRKRCRIREGKSAVRALCLAVEWSSAKAKSDLEVNQISRCGKIYAAGIVCGVNIIGLISPYSFWISVAMQGNDGIVR